MKEPLQYINKWIIYPWITGSHDPSLIHPEDLDKVDKGVGIAYCSGTEGEYLVLQMLNGQPIRVVPREEIQVLPEPEFLPNERVAEALRPDVHGVIRDLGWHHKDQRYTYYLNVNNKPKSRRYSADELVKKEL